MNNWKTILVMLGLVAIGFAAGFSTNRYLTRQYFEKIRKTRGGKNITEELLKTIKLEEAQEKKINPIVKKYSQQLYKNWINYKQQRAILYDSLKIEIAPTLNLKQQKRLERFIKSRKKERKKKKN